jgi:SAM-dependent methyltransferase
MTGQLDGDFWEDRYRSHRPHGARTPSPHLVAATEQLEPGTALEAGCGEGANAVWLARRGWQVTAVDISPTALRRARDHAESAGIAPPGRVDWVEADLTQLEPTGTPFDLVTAHYVHTSGGLDELILRLARAVAPGGILLVVGHDPTDAHSRNHGGAGVSFTPADAAAGLDPKAWEVEASSASRVDTSTGATLHDAVLLARRRSA